jgi:hypothetical protein
VQLVVPVPLRNNGQHETVKHIQLNTHWSPCLVFTLQSLVHVKYVYIEISLNLKFQVFWDIVPYWVVNSYWHSSSELSSSKVREERELFLRSLTVEVKVLCEISGFHHKVDENMLFWVITQWVVVISYWCPIFRGQKCKTGNGTNGLSQNGGKKLPLIAA